MDIAIDCFARFGYQATPIDRFAKAASLTTGTISDHFKDKEELLFEAVKNRVNQFEPRVVSDIGAIQDAAPASTSASAYPPALLSAGDPSSALLEAQRTTH